MQRALDRARGEPARGRVDAGGGGAQVEDAHVGLFAEQRDGVAEPRGGLVRREKEAGQLRDECARVDM